MSSPRLGYLLRRVWDWRIVYRRVPVNGPLPGKMKSRIERKEAYSVVLNLVGRKDTLRSCT